MIYEAPYTPKVGITPCPNVSRNTSPGNSHGKPPNNRNLESSNIIKVLATNKLFKRIFWVNLINRTAAKGAIKTADNKMPINNIIREDITMLVFP